MLQKKIYTDGINSDTSDELLPQGQDRYRLNVRVFSANGANEGAIETVNGNTIVSFTLPVGVNAVIGTKEYLTKNKLYYFLYNGNFNHSIMEFDSIAGVITPVISGPFLNFQPDFLITGINIIELDANNHLLYWTDFNEEPKKINIEKGKFFMAGNFIDGYKSPFNPENVFRIKQPHLLAPVTTYADDPTVYINRLKEKLFQFKVQYVYDDKEISSWGPISKTVYPLSSDTYGKNNKISITVKTGIDIVDRIRIAMKPATDTNFFLIADLNKIDLKIASNTDYTFDFYNDGNYPLLEVNESIKLFDNVPKKSKAQDIIKDNRNVDGCIVEGFDPVNADLGLDLQFSQNVKPSFYVDYITITDPGAASYLTSPPTVVISGDGTGATAQVTQMVVVGFKITKKGAGYIDGTSVSFSGGGGSGLQAHIQVNVFGSVTGVVLVNPGSGYTQSPTPHINQSVTISNAQIEVLLAVKQISITNGGLGYSTASVTLGGYNDYTDQPTASAALSGDKVLPIVSLKRGGKYTYGITYYDHGNRGDTANVNEGVFNVIQSNGRYGTELVIPFYNEPNPLGAAQLSFKMKVDGVNIINAGSSYTGATILTFSGGSPASNATATPIIGAGKITNLTEANIGAGYTPDGGYTVNLSGGTGTGATAFITIVSGAVDTYSIINQGTNYRVTDILSVSTAGSSPVLGVPTTVATFTVNSDYQTIVGANITLSGSGYTSLPIITVVDSGGGTGAQINPTMAVDSITIVSGSSGYVNPPNVTFIGGNPQTIATATAAITSGIVTSITITNVGAGYLTFPVLKVDGRIYDGSYPIVNWNIYNEPPVWATHYQIVRQLNIVNDKYLQFIIKDIQYLDRDFNVKTFGDSTIVQFRIDLSNVLAFDLANGGATLVYDYVQGDRIRFISNLFDQRFDNYYDYEIGYFATLTNQIVVKFPPGTYPNVPDFEEGNLFEIYHPKDAVTDTQAFIYEIACGNTISFDVVSNKFIHDGDIENQFYWAFTVSSNSGGFVRLNNPTVPHGLSAGNKIKIQQNTGFTNAAYNTYAIVATVISPNTVDTNLVFGSPAPTQAGIVTSPAKGLFSGGDTFYRNRTMSYDVSPQYKTFFIEDSNYSDLYPSQGYDYGRPNVIDPEAREVERPSTLVYSEQFVPETNINGLSTVYDTSFQTYESKYGMIQKLYNENQSLLVFQELKMGNIPILQNVFSGTQGGNVVGTSTVVLSPTMRYYDGEYGIGKNPESFAVNGNAKYGIDVNHGVLWRLSTDGLTPISDIYKMKKYFNNKCNLALSTNSSFTAFGVYDISYNEYIISTFIGGGQGETVAFNEKENRFTTFYSYLPDFFGTLGVNIVSFESGSLWIHNTKATQNNFYGAQYSSEVHSVLNILPSNEKILQAVGEESINPWEVYSITTPGGQLSNLIIDDFQIKEDMYYAGAWRDTLTPNVTNPLFEGDEMRSATFLLKFRYNGTTYNKLFATNLNYIVSNLHNK